MAASVYIYELTAAATGVDKTSGTVRFKSANETTVDTNNRLQIPSGATIYSYTKNLQFYFGTAPSVDIQNLRAYSSGSNTLGTGVDVLYDTQTSFVTNTNASIGGTDIFTKTSGANINMATFNAGPYTGTGYKGDILRLQMSVANTAGSGAISPESITFAYDET